MIPDLYALQYIIKTDKAKPKTSKGGAIDFIDKKTSEYAFTIWAAYIQDSYRHSESAELYKAEHITYNNYYYEIEKTDDNEYLLTSFLDEKFLEAETTIYPVLIDPTIRRIHSQIQIILMHKIDCCKSS